MNVERNTNRPTVLGRSRARALRSVRWGFNPNSSSLGADVTGLLLGGGGAMMISVALSVWIRLSARFGGGTPHGTAAATPGAGASGPGGEA